jgi:hypothetical protein
LAWLIGSPVVDFNTFMLLIPMLAPLAWPASDPDRVESTEEPQGTRSGPTLSASVLVDA